MQSTARKRMVGWVLGLIALLTGTLTVPARATLLPTQPVMVDVIVQQWDGADTTVVNSTLALGGTVTRPLPAVLGFAARVPQAAIGTIAALPGVRAVTPDSLVLPQETVTTTGAPSVYKDAIGATATAPTSNRGQGVTVAVIDSGVSAVGDLGNRLVPVIDPTTGQASSCVNFSAEAGCQDSFGHGTFVAGLIASSGASSPGNNGVAPGARLLAEKLSGRDGQSKVSDVIAAIGWTIANKDTYGVRVMNLSLRVDSTLSYRIDPVNFAVERAWAAGIVVVVSAGNMGPGPQTIAKPADDPWVISVGSVEDHGTAGLGDDTVADFSSRGPTLADGIAKPDVVVPGRSLVSLRSPGSAVDASYPYFVDATYRRGSGTSFSAGIVSGTVAAMLSDDPTTTPDRIKYALTATALPVAGGDPSAVGHGMVDMVGARTAPAGVANQQLFHPIFAPAAPGVTADFTGSNWQGSNWQGSNWQGSNWQGSNWQGSNWQGSNWQGSNWQGSNWQAGYWS